MMRCSRRLRASCVIGHDLQPLFAQRADQITDIGLGIVQRHAGLRHEIAIIPGRGMDETARTGHPSAFEQDDSVLCNAQPLCCAGNGFHHQGMNVA